MVAALRMVIVLCAELVREISRPIEEADWEATSD